MISSNITRRSIDIVEDNGISQLADCDMVNTESEIDTEAVPRFQQRVQIYNITNQELQEVELLFAAKDNYEKVLISEFNVNVTLQTFICLRGSNWLNDEIINFYMSMLAKQDMNSTVFFHNTFFMERLIKTDDEYNFSNVER